MAGNWPSLQKKGWKMAFIYKKKGWIKAFIFKKGWKKPSFTKMAGKQPLFIKRLEMAFIYKKAIIFKNGLYL